MKRKFLGVGAALILTLAMTAGCASGTASTQTAARETAAAAEQTSTAAEQSETAAKGQEETKDSAAAERPTKDMAGREIQVPAAVKKVYSTSPVGTNFMYTFDDQMVAGLNVDLSEEEKSFTTDYYQNLPNLGGWFGKGKEGNVEEIIKAAPDIVLSSGVDQSSIDTANQLQEKLGIPVFLINTDFDSMADAYRFLGAVTGNTARGEELAAYTEKVISQAEEITAKIPEDKRVSVYYAEEAQGLNTDPSGSPHSRLIDLCGGINVAKCDISPGYGRTEVSMEQVISWNPQFIIASVDNGYANSGSYDTILSDSQWSVIQAVKDGHVYETPSLPQNWFDRPPSCNTIIGVQWVQNLLYPEYAQYDIRKETKAFYSLFYHYDLTDQDLDKLLARSLRAE